MKCEPQERRKILFITNWYPTKESPGTAVWVREHAKAVRQYDEVVVLHCAGSAVPRRPRWWMEREHDLGLSEGVTTYRLWHRPAALPRSAFLLYVYSVLRSVRRLSHEGFRPDVIHVHVYDAAVPAIIIGKLWRIPVVVSEHFSSFPRRLLGRLDVCKAWLAFRCADMVLPVSAALQAAIEGPNNRGCDQPRPSAHTRPLAFSCCETASTEALTMFLLKAYRPSVYRERFENVNWNVYPSKWTDAQLAAYDSGIPLAQVLAMQPIDVTPAAEAAAPAGDHRGPIFSTTARVSVGRS